MVTEGRVAGGRVAGGRVAGGRVAAIDSSVCSVGRQEAGTAIHSYIHQLVLSGGRDCNKRFPTFISWFCQEAGIAIRGSLHSSGGSVRRQGQQ